MAATLDGGDLGGAQAAEVVQRQRLPLLGRQLIQQAVEGARPLRRERPLLRRRVRVREGVGEGGHIDGRAAPTLVVAQGVAGDAEEPGGEGAPLRVAVEGGERLAEGRRGEILRVGAVADLPEQVAVDRADVAPIEGHEGFRVGAGGGGETRVFIDRTDVGLVRPHRQWLLLDKLTSHRPLPASPTSPGVPLCISQRGRLCHHRRRECAWGLPRRAP